MILELGLKLCGVNEVFDSNDFVYNLCLRTVLLCLVVC